MAAPWWTYATAWAASALAMCIVPSLTPERAWWAGVEPAAMALACAVNCVALGSWRGRGYTAGITQRCAVLVVACDVVGLALGLLLGWDRLGHWGSVSAAGLAVMQGLWLARVRIQR